MTPPAHTTAQKRLGAELGASEEFAQAATFVLVPEARQGLLRLKRGEGGRQRPQGVWLTVRDEGEHRLFPPLDHLRHAVHGRVLSLRQQPPRQPFFRAVVPPRLGALQPP